MKSLTKPKELKLPNLLFGAAKIHSGRIVRPLKKRILCENMDLLVSVTKLALPDRVKSSLARFGGHRTGRPHAVGKVMAIGEDVDGDQINPGMYLIIDAMNSWPLKIDGETYLFPLAIAILCAVDDKNVKDN